MYVFLAMHSCVRTAHNFWLKRVNREGPSTKPCAARRFGRVSSDFQSSTDFNFNFNFRQKKFNLLRGWELNPNSTSLSEVWRNFGHDFLKVRLWLLYDLTTKLKILCSTWDQTRQNLFDFAENCDDPRFWERNDGKWDVACHTLSFCGIGVGVVVYWYVGVLCWCGCIGVLVCLYVGMLVCW